MEKTILFSDADKIIKTENHILQKKIYQNFEKYLVFIVEPVTSAAESST